MRKPRLERKLRECFFQALASKRSPKRISGTSEVGLVRPPHLITGTANNYNEKEQQMSNQQTTYKEPLDGEETVIRNEVRDFKEPEVVKSHDVPIQPIAPYTMLKEAESIKRFIERPFEIDSFEWNPNAAGQILLTSLPHALFNNKAIREKITRYRYFRAGVKFTILINGTSFHYGKLRATWFPEACSDVYYRVVEAKEHYPRNNPIAQTGLNGIDMYPDGSNTYILEAPYMKPIPYLSLADVFSPVTDSSSLLKKTLGTLCITVISPLENVSTTPTNVDITVFAQFTDVQLEGPSVTDYTDTTPTHPFFVVQGDPDEIVVFQASQLQSKTVFQSAKEAEVKSEKGIISSSLNAMANISTLFDEIPEGAAVTAALKGGETLATIMGFSRPPDQRQVEPICVKIPDLSMTEGLQMGHRFTASAEARCDRIKSLMDDKDDNYIIKDIIQRPMLYGRYQINSTVANGIDTIKIVAKPRMCKTYVDLLETISMHNNMSYIASMFRFFRGSIKLHFEFICSNFQTQRFLLGFQPNEGTLSLTNDTSGLIENRIFTVNGMHHEEFVVPWNSNKYIADIEEFLGTVVLRTITKQTSSNGVPAPIFVNVYVSAGPDMEFWGLKPPEGFLPFGFLSDSQQTAEFQSKDMTLAGDVNYKTVGKSIIGESIQGLKQIISRPGYLTASLNNNEVLQVGTQSTNRNSPAFASVMTLCSYLEYIRILFRYCRGTNVVTCMAISDPVEHKAVLQYGKLRKLYNLSTTTTPDFEVYSDYGFNYYPDRSDLLPQFIVPYYSSVPFTTVNFDSTEDYNQISGYLNIARTKGTSGVSYLQAAGDDYQLGCYLGAPSLVQRPLKTIALT